MTSKTKNILINSIIEYNKATKAEKKLLIDEVVEKLKLNKESIEIIGIGFEEDTIKAAEIFLRIFNKIILIK